MELEDDGEPVVCVHDYLCEQGFADTVATAITLHMILKAAMAPTQMITEAAEEIGYSVPTVWERLNRH